MYFSTRTKVLVGTAVLAAVATTVSVVIDQKDLAAACANVEAVTLDVDVTDEA